MNFFIANIFKTLLIPSLEDAYLVLVLNINMDNMMAWPIIIYGQADLLDKVNFTWKACNYFV